MRRANQGAGEDRSEAHPGKAISEAPRVSLPTLGEREVGGARVLTGQTPRGLAVAREVDDGKLLVHEKISTATLERSAVSAIEPCSEGNSLAATAVGARPRMAATRPRGAWNLVAMHGLLPTKIHGSPRRRKGAEPNESHPARRARPPFSIFGTCGNRLRGELTETTFSPETTQTAAVDAMVFIVSSTQAQPAMHELAGANVISIEPCGYRGAIVPSFTMISTRRFFARPSFVSFVSIGSAEP